MDSDRLESLWGLFWPSAQPLNNGATTDECLMAMRRTPCLKFVATDFLGQGTGTALVLVGENQDAHFA